MTNSDSSESCIRLRLTVNKVGRELIKRVTAKGNEVVEVNGFTFVRKRKPSPENDAAAQHNNSAKRQLLAAQERPTHGAIVGEEQEEGLNGAVQGEPAACKGNVLSSPACQEGSMEADAVHTGEGDSQIQVQLLPNTEAHVHFAGTVAPGAPGTSAAQGSPKPAGPASPMQPLLLPQIPPGLPAGAPAADIGLLTAERLGAQLASYLPASCPKLVKLHFVVARALDAAAAQANTPMRHIAHSLSRAFEELIEQEVAACRRQLVTSAMRTTASLQEAPASVTGMERAQGHKQQGQEQVESRGKGSQAAAATPVMDAAAGVEAAATAAGMGAAADVEKAAGAAADMDAQQGSGLASLPLLLRDAVTEGSALAISMQQQLAQLEAEEAAWMSLKQAYARSPAAPSLADGGRAEQGEATEQRLPADGGTKHPAADSGSVPLHIDGGRAVQGQAQEQQHPHQQQQQQEAGGNEQAHGTSCSAAQGVPALPRSNTEAAEHAGAAHDVDGSAAANRADGAGAAISGVQKVFSLSSEAGQERDALKQPLLGAANRSESGAEDNMGAAAAATEQGEAVARQEMVNAGADGVAADAAQAPPQEQGQYMQLELSPRSRFSSGIAPGAGPAKTRLPPLEQGTQQGQQQQGEQQQGAASTAGREEGQGVRASTAGGEGAQGGQQEGSGGGAEGAHMSSDACVRALKEARAQAGAQLMTQVELLASRLARVELLVGRAEQVANSLQADYHQDRFRTFPHVNSPAWLIRRITQAKPPAWEGAEAAVL